MGRSKVLIVGAGDVGFRIADFLAARGLARDVVLAGLALGSEGCRAAISDSSGAARVRFVELDARDTGAVETLLKQERPDVAVNSASLMSPWSLLARKDDFGKRLKSAGIGLQLPAQLPVLLSVMTAVRQTGLDILTANISFPDLTGLILKQLGLAPTIGLGNATIILGRAEAAQRRMGDAAPVGRLRVIAQHAQVYDVFEGRAPVNAADRVQLWAGEGAGERHDDLAYAGPRIEAEMDTNILAAAGAVRVINGLLGTTTTFVSAPAPAGMIGGYPVAISDGVVSLDLPDGVDIASLEQWNWNVMARDGIARVDGDGTTHFTAAAQAAVAAIDPGLCEPLRLDDLSARFERLRHAMASS